MKPRAPDESAIHCTKCVFFWITHQPATPYGCRAFGFRSARLPMIEIRETSGHDCEGFQRKPVKPR